MFKQKTQKYIRANRKRKAMSGKCGKVTVQFSTQNAIYVAPGKCVGSHLRLRKFCLEVNHTVN